MRACGRLAVHRRGLGPKFFGVLFIAGGLCALAVAMWWPVAQALLGVEGYASGEAGAGVPDIVYFRDGTAREGAVVGASGTELTLRGPRGASGAPATQDPEKPGANAVFSLRDVAEIALRGRYLASMPRSPRIYLCDGSVLVAEPGGIETAEGDSVIIRFKGPITSERPQIVLKGGDVWGISFLEWCNPFSDIAADDVVALRDGSDVTGKIHGIGPTALSIERSADNTSVSVAYAKVRTVTFAKRSALALDDRYNQACVVCVADGSRLKGTIVSLDDEKLEMMSPVVGKVRIERGAVTRIAFSEWAVRDEFPVVLEQEGQTVMAVSSYDGVRRVITAAGVPVGERVLLTPTTFGTLLVADEKGNAVYEINADGRVLWRFQAADKPTGAFRLPGGNTLICDYGNNRVIEVTPEGNTVWSAKANGPMGCSRLRNGRNLIVENYRGRVVEVNEAGDVVWEADGLDGVIDAFRQDDGNTLALCGSENLCLRKISAGGDVLWTVEGFSYPARIIAGAEDRIIVCESGPGKLTILDNHGERKRVIDLRPPQEQ
jgi:hypothetical protein